MSISSKEPPQRPGSRHRSGNVIVRFLTASIVDARQPTCEAQYKKVARFAATDVDREPTDGHCCDDWRSVATPARPCHGPDGNPFRILPMSPSPILSPLEARVLGVLVEKEKTVPDIYPLSLNALTAGCNQRNNRDPVINATEAEVQQALDELRRRSLVIESSGSRVMRYTHNFGRVLRVPDQAVAILAALMLRGPQTAGELRIGTERLHRFADVSSVEGFLEELSARPNASGGPLAAKLARRPGEREPRWTQLLTGSPPAQAATELPAAADDDVDDLPAQVRRLAAEVGQLRAEVAALREELASAGRAP
jgi:uncharacterized protein YceH (UPF0502 family)